MRVLIAPQEFKGTLTADEAAQAIATGLSSAFPGWQLDLLPMADGGPGTTAALLTALGGEERRLTVHDPLMRPVEAGWARLNSGVGVVECAAASGLWRLALDELDARRASSYGTGQLIADALDAGCDEVIVGLGGSATNDGGAGMAQALGYRFLDASGADLPPGGAALARLDRIDMAGRHPRIASVRIAGATDVTNPLCGPQGASAVYGPQKGADAVAVAELDAALRHFAGIVGRDLGVAVAERPGTGAAGGLGAGLIAFLGAELRSGAELVGEVAGLEARLRAADIVVTGEGRLDGQTAFGKGPLHVARLARALGRPVVCLAGSLGAGYERLAPQFGVIEALIEDGEPVPSPDETRGKLAAAAAGAVLRLSSGLV